MIIDELERESKVYIEDHATLAPRATLITKSCPNASTIKKLVPTSEGQIIKRKNAWIGAGSIIMPNVTIGEGAIVGAGSVVTRDVPPYTLVFGSPARPVRNIEVPGQGNTSQRSFGPFFRMHGFRVINFE